MAGKVTPLMQQYNRVKTKYPDTILLFRVGDFYETFGKDAIKASQILGITLTKRANGSSNPELSWLDSLTILWTIIYLSSSGRG